MGLKNRLKSFEGKLVLVQGIRGGATMQISGNVALQEDGDVALIGERHVEKGAPIGQNPSTGELIHIETVIPSSKIYFADLTDDEILIIKVTEETVDEARAQIEATKPVVHQVRGVIPPNAGIGLKPAR